MNGYIKQFLTTRAWQDIEEMFKQEILSCKNPDDINPSLSDKILAREFRAKVIASQRIQRLLNNIKLSAGPTPEQKISYK